MAQQALEPFDDRLSYFAYTDVETPVRIELRSAPRALTAMTVRSNVMWALKQLAIDQFHSPSIWGVDFKVLLEGEELYLGKLSNKYRRDGGAVLEGGSGEQGVGNGSSHDEGVSEQEKKPKRALVLTRPAQNATTSTTTSLTITGGQSSPANVQYGMRFQPLGVLLPDIGIFSAILEFLLFLAAYELYQELESANMAYDTLPVWIFVISNVESASGRSLQMYQVLAMLQSIAKHFVEHRIYQELGFNLLADEAIVAVGCVVTGQRRREWCRELDGWVSGVGLGLGGLDRWQNVSVIA